MNCVGIDVFKGKSTIAVMRPFSEVVVSPIEVQHTARELMKRKRKNSRRLVSKESLCQTIRV